MSKLVEGFGGELEKLRAEEAELGPSSLQLLIDSLAAGVEVFNDPKNPRPGYGLDIDELGIILGDS